ncbi:hypothetical protein ZWY2020_050699 [Hordeum vulgare]|nr:hypothetical protein ZWY2020_050699 [Hordeum vulgare]
MASSSSALRMPVVTCAVVLLLLLSAVSRCEADLLQVAVAGRRMLAGGSNAPAVFSGQLAGTAVSSSARRSAAGRAAAAMPYSESKVQPGGPDPQHH